jgi:hypothetical protein
MFCYWLQVVEREELQLKFPEPHHFFNYFEANYLNGIFVPQMWNVYEQNMDTCTNNYVESK